MGGSLNSNCFEVNQSRMCFVLRLWLKISVVFYRNVCTSGFETKKQENSCQLMEI